GGTHSCATTTTGEAYCWGNNFYGQVGDGTITNRNSPVLASTLSTSVISLALGYQYTCAITTGGAAKCWGLNNNGQVGDGTVTTRYTPVGVSTLGQGTQAVASFQAHSCALLANGVKCWGDNIYGQLGNGSLLDSLTPVSVSGF